MLLLLLLLWIRLLVLLLVPLLLLLLWVRRLLQVVLLLLRGRLAVALLGLERGQRVVVAPTVFPQAHGTSAGAVPATKGLAVR